MSNKIYTIAETTIYFVPSGVGIGSQYVQFSPNGLLNGSGHKSLPRDLGATPQSSQFRWRGRFAINDISGDPNGTLDFYWSSFDAPSDIGGTTGILNIPDGSLGSGDIDISEIKILRNLQPIGSILVDDFAASGVGKSYSSSGYVELYGRYGSLVCYNRTGTRLSTTQDANIFSLTPIPDEII